MNKLRELCTKLKDVRDERDKTQARIDALLRVKVACDAQEEELLTGVAAVVGDVEGRMTHEAVQVGPMVAMVACVGGDATVRFMELK